MHVYRSKKNMKHFDSTYSAGSVEETTTKIFSALSLRLAARPTGENRQQISEPFLEIA